MVLVYGPVGETLAAGGVVTTGALLHQVLVTRRAQAVDHRHVLVVLGLAAGQEK